MQNPLQIKTWPPYVVGAGTGVLSWFVFATANHPFGITKVALPDVTGVSPWIYIAGLIIATVLMRISAERRRTTPLSDCVPL